MNLYAVGFVIAVTLGAFALSLTLVPGEQEYALIQLRSKQYGKALESYVAMWQAGDRSVSVLIPLTQLYLQHGEVNRAAEAMQQFVAKNPDHLEARRQLGLYYQYAQRPSDYVQNLQAISRLDASEAVLRELSDSYNLYGQYDRQIEVLHRLVRLYPEDPQDFLHLTHLQAAERRFDAALATLDLRARHHPDAMNDEIVEIYVQLAFAAQQPQRALRVVESWLSADSNPSSVAPLVSLFHRHGEPALAWKLLEPYDARIDDEPALLAEFARVRYDLGDAEGAWARLARLDAARRLPRAVIPEAIQLALVLVGDEC